MRNRLTDFQKWVRGMVAPPLDTPVAPPSAPQPSSHTLSVDPQSAGRGLPAGSMPLHELPSTWSEMTEANDQSEEQGSVWARIMCGRGRGRVTDQVIDARLKEKLRTSPEAMARFRELGIRMD
jgi:hypothetical protein